MTNPTQPVPSRCGVPGCAAPLGMDPNVNLGLPDTDDDGFPVFNLVCANGHQWVFRRRPNR
jgi:hypothetical protein